MPSIEVRLMILCLVVYNVNASLQECAEHDETGIVAGILAEDSKPLPFQDKLEQLFDAFDKNDIEGMESGYKLLENIRTDDDDDNNGYVDGNHIKLIVSNFSFVYVVIT